MRETLIWLERLLLAAGLAIGACSATVVYRSEMVQRMPIPDASARSSDEPQRPRRGAWVARITAPSVRLTATVLEGSDDATLARAAGHIETTALPGEPGNVGIAGHRDTTFMPVQRLRVGDAIDLTTSDRVYRYRVTRILIVDPEDVYVLDATEHATLTLVTCYPFTFFGHAPQRYVIQAELADEGLRAGKAEYTVPS
jgi:sortase A